MNWDALFNATLEVVKLLCVVIAGNSFYSLLTRRGLAPRESRPTFAAEDVLNAFTNGAMWENFQSRYNDQWKDMSVSARRVARRRAAQDTYPEAYKVWNDSVKE